MRFVRLIAVGSEVGLPARTRSLGVCVLLWACVLFTAPSLARAEADDKKPAAPPVAEAKPGDALSLEQQRLADRYKHLEEVLLRMAELTGNSDPRRAALLKKAVAQSKDRLIGVQFESLVDLLKKDELSKAIQSEGDLEKDLQSILELLMSENRAKRIESEKARLREYIKQLNQIIKQQKGIQGRTAEGGDPKGLSKEQRDLAEKTGDLAGSIKKNEESSGNAAGKPGEKNQGDDAKPGDKPKDGDQGKPKPSKDSKQGDKPKDDKQGDQGKTPGGKPGQGQPKDKGQEGSQGEKSDGQKSDGPKSQGPKSQGQGQPGQPNPDGQDKPDDAQDQGSPQDQQTPARKRIEAARERMEEAERKLKEAEREGAVKKQEDAIRELEEAKANLEKILRQLREEETQRMLTMLEARFRKMLQMQREVNDGTVRLDKVPEADRTHDQEIESNRLSGKEAEIVLEADKALALLHEDGTAVAFPEAVEQMRSDMEQVVQRLAQANVGALTQSIEKDILSALEEMIASLQKAIKDQEDKKSPPGQGGGEAQDPPLVDKLSEIKMIRALQMRVNVRTERYSKLVKGEQADNAELLEALAKLGQQQARIHKITRDLETGRNR